ncbi:hypothetical protein P154DRAFT_96576 [Amniculicola lignicola CBS 123094]|uniref:C2H2-type domain-containing protein n=1 Tax=Amniculicola lignicola CBS 123094 TaxID=1392246 RepID=A0A6A5W6A4_9PLEO|nr:hypothetical protein P154DRAFT_96576 [Amniculicola lignicola CBS 123094]
MSTRDQPTPPFNSPYQQAMKSNTTLLQSPAYPSPARSDSEPTKYPTDGLGLYNYSQSFHAPQNASLYPPSPQPTEAWAHLTTGASPLISEGPVETWTATYDPPVSRSPMPWASHHASHRSSLSSTRDMSIFSREGTEHGFPNIKLEGGSEWTTDEERSPHGMRNQPMTVSPDRLTTGVFSYDHSYGSPPLSKYESSIGDEHENRDYQSMSFNGGSRSPPMRDASGSITARTRVRRNPTTAENANFSCHVCGKLFQRSYNHKTHLETHNPTRKKEHVCPHGDCDKLFVRKTDLDRHQNSVHRKLKIFKCLKCDAHFARKDTLRRHEEDGCPKRNELRNPDVLSRRTSMRTGPGGAMPYYHSPRPDMYDTRSPPLFRDDSFPGSPTAYQ